MREQKYDDIRCVRVQRDMMSEVREDTEEMYRSIELMVQLTGTYFRVLKVRDENVSRTLEQNQKFVHTGRKLLSVSFAKYATKEYANPFEDSKKDTTGNR